MCSAWATPTRQRRCTVSECTICPEFVVRCGHLGRAYIRLKAHPFPDGGLHSVTSANVDISRVHCLDGLTRVGLGAEFLRREEALLG